MKRLLLGLFAVIITAGLFAFNNFKNNAEKKVLQSYTWHKYNTAGTEELVPAVTFTGTEEQARLEFGCPEDNETVCARAYDDEGVGLSIYILKSIP